MIVTNDDELAEKLRILRTHGMTAMTWDRHKGHAWSYDVTALGYNYRIDEIHSALGREQLKKLDKNNDIRRHLTSLYREYLQELAPQVSLPFEKVRGISACHLMPILLPKETKREAFMEEMKLQGIQTSIHYPPTHSFQAYADIPHQPLPVTEDVAAREVTLPLYPTLTGAQVSMVAQAVQNSLKK